MDIYIRHKPQGRWITFLNTKEQLSEFILDYRIGSRVLIGDVGQFSATSLMSLLKFVEDYSSYVDLYSSYDINFFPILSRASNVYKEPLDLGFCVDDVGDLSAENKLLLCSTSSYNKVIKQFILDHD